MKWIHGIQCWKHLNPDPPHARMTKSFGPDTWNPYIYTNMHLIYTPSHPNTWPPPGVRVHIRGAPCGVTHLIPAEPYFIVALKNKTYLYTWYMHHYTLTPGHPQVWGCNRETPQTQLGSQQQRKCLKNTWKNTWKKRRGTHHHTSVVHPVAPCDAPYGVTYLIPAEPYYQSPEKLNLLALLTYPRTLKCRESWPGISYTP